MILMKLVGWLSSQTFTDGGKKETGQSAGEDSLVMAVEALQTLLVVPLPHSSFPAKAASTT